MNNEYIILNKTLLADKILELKKEREEHEKVDIGMFDAIWAAKTTQAIDLLEEIISLSTPLIPEKKKVFVSFDFDDDKNYKKLFKAWDANPDFDFYISDLTSKEIDTCDISRIKASLTTSIRNAAYTLVIIGKNANKRHPEYLEIGYKNWINFVIAKSKENKNRLVCVKIDREYESPSELTGTGASWATSFTKESIINALHEAEPPFI